MSKKPDFYTWDTYVAEAARDDFIVKLPEGKVLNITNPTGARALRVSQGLRNGDLDVILLGLTGEAYPELQKLLEHVGHLALPKLVEDLMDHFDMYDEVELTGPGGGTVTASRPTRIRQLLGLGYVVKGEAAASRG